MSHTSRALTAIGCGIVRGRRIIGFPALCLDASFVEDPEVGRQPNACVEDSMDRDPVATNPELYRVIFENERVRVLEYLDEPGDRTEPHSHPDSVMYTLTTFRRRLYADDQERDVEIAANTAAWLPAQRHAGHNIGDTPTKVIFVELKEAPPERQVRGGVGPAGI